MQHAKQQDLFLNYSSCDEATYYHTGGNHGFFSILTKSSPDSALKQHSYRLSQMETVLDLLDNRFDSYISQAEFLKPNRRVVNLLRLSLCFVDIDIYNCPEFAHLKDYDPETVAEFLKTACSDQGILPPSIIIYSGRGYYLKWFFETPLPRQALPRWNAVQRALIEKLKHIGADPAARDASRILRLVCSTNSKSGQIVRVAGATYAQEKIIHYSFDQLADETLEFTREEIQQFREDRAKKKNLTVVKGNKKNGLKGFSGRRLAWDRLEDIRRLAQIRGGIQEGDRMQHLFWQLNFMMLSGAVTSTQMYHECAELAKAIDPSWGYKSEELSTLYEKAKDYNAGKTVEFNGKQYPALYTPKNETLLQIFSVTPEEETKLATIISRTEARERDRVRAIEKRRAKGQIERSQYLANSITKQKPWEKLGVSRSKWYEMKKNPAPVDTKEVKDVWTSPSVLLSGCNPSLVCLSQNNDRDPLDVFDE